MSSGSVWVIDDDRSIRWVLERALAQVSMDVKAFSNGSEAIRELDHGIPDAILSDIRMPGMDGFEVLAQISERFPDLPIIIMTAFSDLDSTVAAYQKGAFEYLAKPFDIDEAVAVAERAVHHSRPSKSAPAPEGTGARHQIIGSAPSMQEVFRAIGRLARSNITVLITGESGTGKELVARALHDHSPRTEEQFVAINTAAIPHDLLESELFGHERGAFTGAQQRRIGRFEQADRGTLFLDEIGDMPADLQTRLLRVLAEGEFYRVGGHTPVRVNVRIIAATHQDLEQRVAEGKFREDLFHRLNVIRIHAPSLRDRREDVPELARYFLAAAADELGVETKALREETERYLCTLPWPGNVRQLENTCRWLTVMGASQEVHVDDLPPELLAASDLVDTESIWADALALWAQQRLELGDRSILDVATPRFETTLIRVALRHTGGRKQEAALLLGWGRNTLTRKLKELGFNGDALSESSAEEAELEEPRAAMLRAGSETDLV